MTLQDTAEASNPEKLMLRGDKLFAQKDFMGAKAVYGAYLHLRPDTPYVLYKLGETERILGHNEHTDILFAKAKRLFTDMAEKSAKDISNYFRICLYENDIDAIRKCVCDEELKQSFLHCRANKQLLSDLYQGIPNFTTIYDETGLGEIRFYKCAMTLMDKTTTSVNVNNALRVTVGSPEYFSNTVHCYGSCQVQGYHQQDAFTIPSYLQKLYNIDKSAVRVLNYGVGGTFLYNHFLRFLNSSIKYGDTVLFFDSFSLDSLDFDAERLFIYLAIHKECLKIGARFFVFIFPNLVYIQHPSERELWLSKRFHLNHPLFNLERIQSFTETIYAPEYHLRGKVLDNVIQRPHNMGEVFFDFSHWNHQVNQLMASEVYSVISESIVPEEAPITDSPAYPFCLLRHKAVQSLATHARKKYGITQGIQQWIDSVRNAGFTHTRRIGAIVMNANPFTWGHYYLVEYALSQVDYLYIFVVSEDKAIFPFADRFRLVCEGTHFFGNRVCVVPSGQFIISSFSFPGYFSKAQAHEPADSTTDILIFGAIIAPALGIRHRFVGDEPNCITTNSYNEMMRFLLPDMNIFMHVIPRKKYCGEMEMMGGAKLIILLVLLL